MKTMRNSVLIHAWQTYSGSDLAFEQVVHLTEVEFSKGMVKILHAMQVHLTMQAHFRYCALLFGISEDTEVKCKARFSPGCPLVVMFAQGFEAGNVVFPNITGVLLDIVTDPLHTDFLGKHLLFPESLAYLRDSTPEGNARCIAANNDLASFLASPVKEVVKGLYYLPEWFAADAGSVLSFYGVRVGSDYDLLYNSSQQSKWDSKQLMMFDNHAKMSVFKYQEETLTDILYEQGLHGFCYGVKFVALSQVEKFKKRRRLEKDIRDLDTIHQFFLDEAKAYSLSSMVKRKPLQSSWESCASCSFHPLWPQLESLEQLVCSNTTGKLTPELAMSS